MAAKHELLTYDDVVDLTGLSRDTLRNSDVPRIAVNQRVVRFRREAVEAWLQNREISPSRARL